MNGKKIKLQVSKTVLRTLKQLTASETSDLLQWLNGKNQIEVFGKQF